MKSFFADIAKRMELLFLYVICLLSIPCHDCKGPLKGAERSGSFADEMAEPPKVSSIAKKPKAWHML
jgi:hypothetical protein